MFIFGQAFIIAKIFSDSFRLSEKLKVEIEKNNIELEDKVKERTKTLKDTNDQLLTALGEIKTLSGLLPICSSYKKIRDKEGNWEHIEIYIRDNSQADFTHGICPDCIKKLYPNFVDKI